eukprot:TRINITY_DN21301_c0_g1_i1.p1 TRINITY_DN21301_c0_g1~~TRINITY_DN21301_c0_g1_i1.p1  ORF type:complete len:284 (-),score=66.18 TRINITY_DN21301_c0_g1_i1:23-817(-)
MAEATAPPPGRRPPKPDVPAEGTLISEAEDSAGGAADDPLPSTPQSYLLIHNLKSKTNIGQLVRSAVAFGVREIIVYGAAGKLSTFGNQGTVRFMRIRYFLKLEDALRHIRVACNARLCGVEILPQARPVHEHPFEGNTCFLLGNEGDGLSDKQIAMCDSFVYIPQYGAGTASLNVMVAGSIVMHHFALWAGKQEHSREGAKFVVDTPPSKLERFEHRTEEDDEEIQARRAARTAERDRNTALADEPGLGLLEGDDSEGDAPDE